MNLYVEMTRNKPTAEWRLPCLRLWITETLESTPRLRSVAEPMIQISDYLPIGDMVVLRLFDR